MGRTLLATNFVTDRITTILFWFHFYYFHFITSIYRMKNQSFLVPNLLNNQSDFFKVLWRHYFDQDKLDSKHLFFKNIGQNPFLNFNKLIWTNQWVVAIVVQTKTKIKVWEDLSQVTKTELQKPTKSDFFFIISESY